MKKKIRVSGLKFKAKFGSTLIEMLIYMGLLSIFLVVLTEMFTSVLNIFAQTETTSAIEQDTRYISSRFASDIGKASAITIPNLGVNQNSLTMTIDAVSHTYNISGDDLVLTNNLGTNAVNSSQTKISNLSFLRLGNVGGKNSLKINFTITSETEESKGPKSRNYQTTIGIR